MEISATPTSRRLVLLVDDVDDNLEMYAMYLLFCGYRVETASNGSDAFDKAIKLQPDVIVMDLSMPVMDGWTACRRLKLKPETRHIPLIALTAHALEGADRAALAVGFDAYLRKPCLPHELVEVIQQHLAA